VTEGPPPYHAIETKADLIRWLRGRQSVRPSEVPADPDWVKRELHKLWLKRGLARRKYDRKTGEYRYLT
jgi:hypothetical protein